MHEQGRAKSANAAPSGLASGARRARLKPWQRRVFLLVFSAVFALVVLGAIEGSLRLAGYGGYPATFDEVGTLPGGSTLVMTSNAGPGSYFFANRSRAGGLEPDAFISPKPEGTFRVFLVGASAAKGSPYMPPFTSACFLEEMLGDIWPERDVEVINLGTTAVASYPVLGMMTEALAYEPDLVVVYAGNNEYYGAYGVASLHSAGRSPGMIRLIRWTRGLAVAQFIDARLRRELTGENTTLMEAMVGKAAIGADDPARAAATRNLSAFIGRMVDRCRSRGVPVVVCAPPCSERNLAPLGGPSVAGAPAEALTDLRRRTAEIWERVEQDPAAGESAAWAILAEHPDLATAHYLLGLALFAQARFDEAGAEFRQAVDLDPMPWRPPSASVAAIRGAVESRGAVLCDLQRAFRDASPGGSIGWELMDDHVHPSLLGQELVARSIVRTLSGVEGPAAVAPERLAALPDAKSYFERLGWNGYDAFAAAHAMRTLGEIGFYKSSNPQFFERFERECQSRVAAEPREVVQQITAWLDPATHKGGHRPIAGMAGRAAYSMGAYREADRLFDVARRAVTPYGSWELQYTYSMLMARAEHAGGLGEEDRAIAREAITHGEFLCSLGPTATGAGERYMGELHQMCGEFAESIPYLGKARLRLVGVDRLLVDQGLVRAYLETGEPERARAIVEEGLQAGGPLAENYRQMGRELGG